MQDDWSAEDDLEGNRIITSTADSEFKRHLASLRRQAGLDLKWWEKCILWACKRLRIDFRFR